MIRIFFVPTQWSVRSLTFAAILAMVIVPVLYSVFYKIRSA